MSQAAFPPPQCHHPGFSRSDTHRHHPDTAYDDQQSYYTSHYVNSNGVHNAAWDNLATNVSHVQYIADAIVDGAHNQNLPDQMYNEHAGQDPSGSAHWAYQGAHYTYPAQPEGTWGTQHDLQHPHTTDAQYPLHDTCSDSTGSISPMSDTSQESLPATESISHPSTSSIANWNIYPHHQYQHHADASGGLSDPRESYAHSPVVADVGRPNYGSEHHHVQPDYHACAEHRRSRHAPRLLLSQRQDDQPQSMYHEISHPDPYSHHDPQTHSPADEYTQSPIGLSYPMSQYDAPHGPQRPPSPMAHLPYPEDVEREHIRSSYSSPTSEQDARWVDYRGHPSPGGSEEHLPRPFPVGHERTAFLGGPSDINRRPGLPPSASIAIPAPPRSPPLIEDPPKKPLTLACLFCRKRKIACGSPPPGSPNRTCNQCARRSLKCVYPAASRRGMRPRARDNEPASVDGVFHMEVPVVVVTQ